jgi:hypothetical protein
VVDVGTVATVVEGVGGLVVGGTVACVVGGAVAGAAATDGSVVGGVLVEIGVAATWLVGVAAGEASVETTGRGDAGVEDSPLRPTAAPTSEPAAMTPSIDPTTSQGAFRDEPASGSSSKSGTAERGSVLSPNVGSSTTDGYPRNRGSCHPAYDIVYGNIGLGTTSFESIVPTINGAQAMLEFLAPVQDVEWRDDCDLRTITAQMSGS